MKHTDDNPPPAGAALYPSVSVEPGCYQIEIKATRLGIKFLVTLVHAGSPSVR